MESKYKERAIKILVKHYGCDDIEDLRICFLENLESITMVLEAMCILAKEVEIRYKLEMITAIKQVLNLSKNDYTKEQVEELLQKQREYCAENAKLNNNPNNKEVFNDLGNVIYPEQYTIDYSAETIIINRNSILDAKLEI